MVVMVVTKILNSKTEKKNFFGIKIHMVVMVVMVVENLKKV
jgi:hypothetical protein